MFKPARAIPPFIMQIYITTDAFVVEGYRSSIGDFDLRFLNCLIFIIIIYNYNIIFIYFIMVILK